MDMTVNDVRQMWIKALASDEYNHGQYDLVLYDKEYDVVRHCCLGVLSEMAHEAGIIYREEGTQSPFYLGNKWEQKAYLPDAVKDWAGLTNGDVMTLACANDDDNTTDYTPTIAIIESLPLPNEDMT